jgi:hypothetical protein
MRKAAWGAVAFGAFALTFGSPVRDVRVLHSLLSLAGLAGYLLLSWEPPVADLRRFRRFLLAGIVASVAAFLIAVTGAPYPLIVLARLLAVASVALPLWLVAGPARSGFIAAGVLAAVTVVPALHEVGGLATSTHAYVLALSCFAVALLLERPGLLAGGERRPPRVVVGRDVVFLTPEEKAERLARLERRFQAGEIPEHKYWDLRQEIESR